MIFFFCTQIYHESDRIYPSLKYEVRSPRWGSLCPFSWLGCKKWLTALHQCTPELLFRDRHGWSVSPVHELLMCRFGVFRIIKNPILSSKIELYTVVGSDIFMRMNRISLKVPS